MNATTVRRELAKAIKERGSLRKWAAAHKIAPSIVSEVLRSLRPLPNSILAPLGIERIDREPIYRRKNGAKP